MDKRRITYSIGETEKLTGASQKQIRYWESRGYISEPIARKGENVGLFSVLNGQFWGQNCHDKPSAPRT